MSSSSSFPLVDIPETSVAATPSSSVSSLSSSVLSSSSRPLNLRSRPRRSGLFTLPTPEEEDDPFDLKSRPRNAKVSHASSSIETPVSQLVNLGDDSVFKSSQKKENKENSEPLENWDLLQKEAQSLAGNIKKNRDLTPAKHLNLLDNFSPVANASPLFSTDESSGKAGLEGFLVGSSPELSPPKRALSKIMKEEKANHPKEEESIQSEVEPKHFQESPRKVAIGSLIDLGGGEAPVPVVNAPLAKAKVMTDLLSASPCRECKCEKKKEEEDVPATKEEEATTPVMKSKPVAKPPLPRVAATPTTSKPLPRVAATPTTVTKRRSLLVAPSPTPLKGRRSLLPATPTSVRQPISFRATPSLPRNAAATPNTARVAKPVLAGSTRRPLATTQMSAARSTPTFGKAAASSSSSSTCTVGTPLKAGSMPMKRRSLIATPSRMAAATPRQQQQPLFSANKPPLVPSSASKPRGLQGKDLFRAKATPMMAGARTPMVATQKFAAESGVASVAAARSTSLRPRRRISGLPSPMKRN